MRLYYTETCYIFLLSHAVQRIFPRNWCTTNGQRTSLMPQTPWVAPSLSRCNSTRIFSRGESQYKREELALLYQIRREAISPGTHDESNCGSWGILQRFEARRSHREAAGVSRLREGNDVTRVTALGSLGNTLDHRELRQWMRMCWKKIFLFVSPK